MKVEKVTVSDAAELLEIYKPYVEKTAITFEYDVPSLEEFENRIKTIGGKFPYLKAVDDNGKILAYAYAATFKARAAYDWSVETTIYVREDSRRCGAGKILYDELERLLKDMGILNMNACIAKPKCADAHLTDDSILFHGKMGFTEVGTFHDSGYKFNTWYDMIWMEKMIGEHSTNQEPVKFYDR